MAFLPSQLHTCQVFNLPKGNSLICKGCLNTEEANWKNQTLLKRSNEKGKKIVGLIQQGMLTSVINTTI